MWSWQEASTALIHSAILDCYVFLLLNLFSSLFFRLGKFYLFIFKFPHSFLCDFFPDIQPIQWVFYFCCHFQLQNFRFRTLFFISSTFLLELSIFPIISRVFALASWSIFTVATLKCLSDNSNTCTILGLASFDCFFPLELRCSWFFMPSNFRSYPEYFEYYVARLWVFFKSLGECSDFCFSIQNRSIRFRPQVQSWLLWSVIPTSVQFSKPLQCCLELSEICATQWSV